MSLYIFVLNILGLGGTGTILSAHADSKGYNWIALLVGLSQMSLVMSGLFVRQYYDLGAGLRFIPYAAIMIGWSWGVWHGKKLMDWTYDRFEDGKEYKDVLKIKDQKDLVIDKSHFLRSTSMDEKYPVTKVPKKRFLAEKLFRNYRDAAKKLDHPNLSLPFSFYKDDDNYHIVHKELGSNYMNLSDFIRKRKSPLSEQHAAHIAY